MPDALALENLTKRYGQDDTPVIDGLTHTFTPGTATGLVGPNGSGKTTLLHLLAVLAYPSSGRITYGSLDIHTHPHRYLKHAGIVHDEPDLPVYLSAVELLEWVVRARDRWDEGAPDRIDALLDTVRLDERRHNLIGTYSSGMERKTQIAAALAIDPSILLMDEPFRALDDATRRVLVDRLRTFTRDGGILILSSHLRASLEAVCGTFLEMGGEVTAER